MHDEVSFRISLWCYRLKLLPNRKRGIVKLSLGREPSTRRASLVIQFVKILIITLTAMLTLSVGSAFAVSSLPRWSPPFSIGLSSSVGKQVNYSISCPSIKLCIVVSGNGDVSYRRHGFWTSPTLLSLGGSIDSISCANQTFCVAVASGESATYNGHSWSRAIKMGPKKDTYEVSCPTTTFCAAVGDSAIPGQASAILAFDGRSWINYGVFPTRGAKDRLVSVSCSTPQFCMAVNLDGEILGFNGKTWSPSRPFGAASLVSVSCASSGFCMAVTLTGEESMYRDGTWSSEQPIEGFKNAGAYSISCVSVSECTVIGLSGMVTTRMNGRWLSPLLVFPGEPAAGVAISCASLVQCVAVNDRGLSTSR